MDDDQPQLKEKYKNLSKKLDSLIKKYEDRKSRKEQVNLTT